MYSSMPGLARPPAPLTRTVCCSCVCGACAAVAWIPLHGGCSQQAAERQGACAGSTGEPLTAGNGQPLPDGLSRQRGHGTTRWLKQEADRVQLLAHSLIYPPPRPPPSHHGCCWDGFPLATHPHPAAQVRFRARRHVCVLWARTGPCPSRWCANTALLCIAGGPFSLPVALAWPGCKRAWEKGFCTAPRRATLAVPATCFISCLVLSACLLVRLCGCIATICEL